MAFTLKGGNKKTVKKRGTKLGRGTSRRTPKKEVRMSHFPGEAFQKYIETGQPRLNGKYLCYCKATVTFEAIPICPVRLINFRDGHWINCPEMVLGWVGPLPSISYDELWASMEDGTGIKDCCLLVYVIGPESTGETGNSFRHGPFYDLGEAKMKMGKPGEYIWQFNSRKTGAVKMAIWDEDPSSWVEIGKEKNVKRKDKKRPAPLTPEFQYVIATIEEMKKGKQKKGPFTTIKETMSEASGLEDEHYIWSFPVTDRKAARPYYTISKRGISPIPKIDQASILKGMKTKKKLKKFKRR